MNDRSLFRLVNKARQIGFSTCIGAEGVQKASVSIFRGEPYKANYISINQTEAADKIDIARNIYHSIPDELAGGEYPLKPTLWTDSEHEISFHRPPNTSTLISQPASSAIRGGRKDIYFDEFAHIRDAVKLYRAAMPAISRGDSRLSIISTPLGQSGLFYDIATDTVSYPQYSRHAVPWWESQAMVGKDLYAEALAFAAAMDTDTRVAKYGSDKLKAIRSGFGPDIQGFITEYEATFVDETEAYYPWDLIVACADPEMSIWNAWRPGYDPLGAIAIGVDLAKERDETVFTVTEHTEGPDGDKEKKVLYIYHTQASYERQFNELASLIKATKASRVTIDQTGVGQVFVERAKRELTYTNIEGTVFTNQKKERWATQLKGDMQAGLVRWPRHPELMRQIHAIRRTKTEANFYKFAGPRDDYFWSLVLSLYGEGRVPVRLSLL